MDSIKIKELIAELEQDIKVKEDAVACLRRLLWSVGAQAVAEGPISSAVISEDLVVSGLPRLMFGSTDSYVDLTVKLIQANGGRPLSVASIVEQIRTLKGNSNIERRSVEATLYQHSKKAASPRLAKIGTGMYGLRKPSEETAA